MPSTKTIELGKGCLIETVPDPRHFPYEKSTALGAGTIPELFALEPQYVTNQLQIPSCVGHATASAKSVQEGKQVSPRVAFGLTKREENYTGYGTYIHKTLGVFMKIGVTQYGFLKEDSTLSADAYMRFEVDDALLSNATVNKIKSYWYIKVGDWDMAMEALYKERVPLITYLNWYAVYNNPKNGILPPPNGGNFEGHAVLFLGKVRLPDGKIYAKFQTSWGTSWGDKGCFYIPFDNIKAYGIGAYFIITDIDRNVAELLVKYDGKLIKQKNSPEIYLVKGGLKRHIEGELAFWLYTSQNLTTAFEEVSPEVIELLNTGTPIRATDFDEKTLRVVRNLRDLYKANPAYAQILLQNV